jgi:hypothetical protein
MKTNKAMTLAACGMLLAGAFLGASGNLWAGVTVTEQPSEPAPTPAPTPAPKATPILIVYGGDFSSTPYAASGWMGNAGAIGFNDRCTDNPHSGVACIKLDYKAADNWGGIAWQDPPNDWGDKDGGHNLTGATKLTFWARGQAGGEKVDFYFGAIKPPKPFYDTDTGKISTTLTTDWKQYTIDLTGKNLTRIKIGFGWSLAGQGHPVTFYLDNIQYE